MKTNKYKEILNAVSSCLADYGGLDLQFESDEQERAFYAGTIGEETYIDILELNNVSEEDALEIYREYQEGE